MLDFSIDSTRILLDTAVLSVFISTPFTLTVLGLVAALRGRKLWRDRQRKAQPAPIFEADIDWDFK